MGDPGWVDSQFLEPNFDLEQVDSLIPSQSADDSSTTQSGAGVSTQALNESQLLFQISHEPVYVWPGQQLEMTFTITNSGDETAADVRIRDDFPPDLIVVDVANGDDWVVELKDSSAGSSVLVAGWPDLAAGESISIKVILRVDEDAESGNVIDNLAIAEASNADGVTAGITIGMPPTSLPGFQ